MPELTEQEIAAAAEVIHCCERPREHLCTTGCRSSFYAAAKLALLAARGARQGASHTASVPRAEDCFQIEVVAHVASCTDKQMRILVRGKEDVLWTDDLEEAVAYVAEDLGRV